MSIHVLTKVAFHLQAEEKMRLLLAKNSKRLKLLDQQGAEAHKIDATRNLLRKLSTKIRIAVRVIAKVSRKINKIRDEELGPQLNTLIQGYVSFLSGGLFFIVFSSLLLQIYLSLNHSHMISTVISWYSLRYEWYTHLNLMTWGRGHHALTSSIVERVHQTLALWKHGIC